MERAALEVAVRAAREAGEFLLRRARPDAIRTKRTASDLVTDADRLSERVIVRRIRRAFPRHDILAEEETRVSQGAEARWLVDPLDGTVNFVHGFPLWSVSIALEVGGVVRLGVVHCPPLGELFVGRLGRGATCNGRRLRVSKTRSLRDAFLATGFPYTDSGRSRNLRYFSAFLTRSRGIRRAGSAAIDLAYTAAGIFDGFWEFGLKAWDIAAGALLVREAGGTVTSLEGGRLEIDSGRIAASNGRIHRAMLDVILRVR